MKKESPSPSPKGPPALIPPQLIQPISDKDKDNSGKDSRRDNGTTSSDRSGTSPSAMLLPPTSPPLVKPSWDALNGRDPSAADSLLFVFAQPTVFPSRDPKK